MNDRNGVAARARLAAAIEATRLGYGLAEAGVVELVRSAAGLGARGVCVPGAFVRAALKAAPDLGTRRLEIVTVVNFPTGDHAASAVDAAVVAAVRDGADHVDAVVPGSLIERLDWRGVAAFVRRIRSAISTAGDRTVQVKAILETAAWNPDRIRGAGLAAVEGGADWLKTSTGFHPAGGATVAAVALLRELAPAPIGVKASGGIRTPADALAMLDAGADRIGTSAERAILAGAEDSAEG